jgi:hypothetical protein
VATKYRALNGLNYTPVKGKAEVRREPGDVLTDLPAKAAAIYLAQGDIEEID